MSNHEPDTYKLRECCPTLTDQLHTDTCVESRRRYTLEEARRKIDVDECAEQGHPPESQIRTLADPLGKCYCSCGTIIWLPKEKG